MIDRKMEEKIKKKEAVMQKEIERIVYYLVSIENTQESLERRPYMILEDMAVVFGILDIDGATIHEVDDKKAMDHGWSEKFLWERAKRNTELLLPARIEPVSQTIIGHTEDEPVFLLSNEARRYGAGTICYENVLQDFSMKYGWNLYLLPTSIHEFMILFDQGIYNEENLQKILQESNQKLDQKEFLSDNIYYYDRDQRQFFAIF